MTTSELIAKLAELSPTAEIVILCKQRDDDCTHQIMLQYVKPWGGWPGDANFAGLYCHVDNKVMEKD